MIILLAITSYVKPAGLVAISKRGEKIRLKQKKGKGKKGGKFKRREKREKKEGKKKKNREKMREK